MNIRITALAAAMLATAWVSPIAKAQQEAPGMAPVVSLMSDVCVPHSLGSSAQATQFKAGRAGYKPLPAHPDVLSGPVGHVSLISTPAVACTILLSTDYALPRHSELMAAVADWISTAADGPFDHSTDTGWAEWNGPRYGIIVSDEVNVSGEHVLMVEVTRKP